MFCPFLSIVLVLNNYRKNHYYDTTTTKTRIFSRISVRLSSELERKCTIVLFCSHTLLLSLAFSLSLWIYIKYLTNNFLLPLAAFWVRPIAPISLFLSRLQSKTPLNCNANYKLKISPFVVLLRLSLRLALTFNHRRALPRSGFDFDLIVCVCVLVCSLNRHR